MVTALTVVAVLCLTGEPGTNIVKVPAKEEYVYVNPDEITAKTDEGMKIDGVLDETVYSEKKWLELSNNDGGNEVHIAMTSHFGNEGMYLVFDVTESVPIYVNPDRSPTLNSCIELYLGALHVKGVKDTSFFEIDLLPTGEMLFKKSDGKYGYINVASTNDIMARLGATTKGGEVNTTECYGYALELFIPWAYMDRLGMDVDAMKDNFVLINVAHITSYNYTGKNHDVDRYWYHYAQQIGTDFTNVAQYFRFSGEGIMGASEITQEKGEHYSFKGSGVAFPGMQVPITIIPDDGYALTSILVDGQEQIQKAVFNEDGSVTLTIRCTGGDQKISAVTEAVTAGKKTLSGKLFLNSLPEGTLDGVFISYVGPLGEKPVTVDSEGNFQLKDLDQGFYILKIEKDGYAPTAHGVYVNRDMYVELAFKNSVFTVTRGSCWILDDENKGILYKLNGSGDLISKASYDDFVFETYLKYDPELAKLSNDDLYLQQRSGIRILFSNGKCWHIDLMRENDRYIVQYAKMSGENSLFSWKTVHTLTDAQIKKYSSQDGIKLTVKRVGNKAAICLDDKVLFIEELAAEYAGYTAQLGFEAWIANPAIMQFPYSITRGAKLPDAPKIYFYSANSWDITDQGKGVVYKTGIAGGTTWLDSAIKANDITTTAKDLSPNTGDYCMVYIFTFSNGEQFRIRLNHTDNDGKYRIQSFAGSTLVEPWKNYYTLTDAQAQKAMGSGIEFRVWISGTTAYVYLDGQQVCIVNLSTVVATGKPSGIEKASVNVHLRVDGNVGKTFAVPFKLVQTNGSVAPSEPVEPDKPAEPDKPIDPGKKVTLNIGTFANGTVTPDYAAYEVGDTVTLTVIPANGYAQKLTINGEPLLLDPATGKYSFVATGKTYEIGGSFVAKSNWFWTADFNMINQGHGIAHAPAVAERTGELVPQKGVYSSVSVLVKDASHGAQKDYAIVLKMAFVGGNHASVRLIDRDDNGKYCLQAMNDSFSGWNTLYWLTDAENAAVKDGDGVWYGMAREGTTLKLLINDKLVKEIDMSAQGITAETAIDQLKIQSYNFGYAVDIPYIFK